ncbi:uncharacterized protein N7529_005255 [Penicillium soppii]|jgi:hypothetical protein|uniref:uncharacterized protein n=1 Tax=Penicillium soppii TaxID=69789 RepID=UPI0025479B8F|nr:uncharacterized protein N7529_005255 [Penicillium soppii]KAJ5872902.1 hypothetical protein N7529_005255 [Penicillium soppii]
MFILVPLYLFVCSVSAVKFYGHAIPEDLLSSTLSHLSEALEGDLRYSSLFMSQDFKTQNGSDFLANELGVFDMTLEEYFAEEEQLSSTLLPSVTARPSAVLGARSSVDQLRCGHNAVEDTISEKNRKHICGGAAALASAIPGGLAMILDSSRGCSEASSGMKVACKTVVLITGVSGVGFTFNEVNNFCLDYMEANGKRCSSQGLSGSNSKASITVRNTQTGPTCADYDETCREYNA